MAALVIDTSSWVSYLAGRGDGSLVESALSEGRVHLPLVVAAELFSGRLSERQRKGLAGLLGRLPPCGADLDHWFRVGCLRARLASKGVSLTIPDAHVAECALELGAELLTEDRIFAHVARHAPLRLA